MSSSKQQRNSVYGLLLAAAIASADSLPAYAGETHQFSVDAADAGQAIQAFGKQAGLQIFASAEQLSGKRLHNVSGELSIEQGLRILLADSGLKPHYVGDHSIAFVAADGKSKDPNALRTAQVDQTSADTSAPSSLSESGVLAEVIVTAQKREERLIDVPVSIVALGADELQKRQINTLEDLAGSVPDLSVVRAGGFTSYEIRGISSLTGSGPLIGIYFDETSIGGITPINPITYDLERVEVLRGPQGTLYGDGSAGGTIRFISKNPNLSSWGLDSQVTAMFTQDGDPSQRINAMVNVPLIENQLGLRVAATSEHDGGWIDQPSGGQKNTNAQNLTNLRVKGLWQPTPEWTVAGMVIINRNDRGFDFSDANSPHTFTPSFGLTTIPHVKSDYDLYSLTTTYDFSTAARLINIVSYLKTSAPQFNYNQLFQVTAPPSQPYGVNVPYESFTQHLLTDELRLSSAGAGRWQWTLGGFFRHAENDTYSPTVYIGQATPPVTLLPNPISPYISSATLSKSWSAFGDTSFRLSDRFTVGAGVRYFKDDRGSINYLATLANRVQDGSFHSIDPRAYMQFKLTPDVNIYASAAKGFRSGGFNAVGQPTYRPESVWTYEGGTKMAFLEGRVALDTAVFLSNYSDYVVFGADTSTGRNSSSNAGDARIKGIEGSLTWQPLPQWRFEARGDYLNARFVGIDAARTGYVAGDPIDLVPRYQFTVAAQRDFSLLDKPGFIRVDYNQQGPETYRNRYVNGPGGGPSPWFYAQSEITRLLGLHTSLQLNSNLRLGVFVQNVLNDQHFDTPYWYVGNEVRAQPRTVGIEFSASLDQR